MPALACRIHLHSHKPVKVALVSGARDGPQRTADRLAWRLARKKNVKSHLAMRPESQRLSTHGRDLPRSAPARPTPTSDGSPSSATTPTDSSRATSSPRSRPNSPSQRHRPIPRPSGRCSSPRGAFGRRSVPFRDPRSGQHLFQRAGQRSDRAGRPRTANAAAGAKGKLCMRAPRRKQRVSIAIPVALRPALRAVHLTMSEQTPS